MLQYLIQKTLRPLAAAALKEVGCGRIVYDLAIVHKYHAVRNTTCKSHFVGHDYACHTFAR